MCMSNKNTLLIWCIDYCSLLTSKLYYSTQHLIQHCIVCIATLRRTNANGEWFNNERRSNWNNNRIKRSACYQSNIISISSTKSPISSGLTNTRTRNSSMAQRRWWCSLNFRMIRAWGVGEIEFQCRLPQFVISTRLEVRLASGNQNGVWTVNMTNLGENEVRHQEWRSAWCPGRGGQRECWWWWRRRE